jgi:hypothetical protein
MLPDGTLLDKNSSSASIIKLEQETTENQSKATSKTPDASKPLLQTLGDLHVDLQTHPDWLDLEMTTHSSPLTMCLNR